MYYVTLFDDVIYERPLYSRILKWTTSFTTYFFGGAVNFCSSRQQFIDYVDVAFFAGQMEGV